VDFAVEDYFRQLPIDSIYNKSIIRLILEQGLSLSTHASQLIYNNSSQDIDSVWNTIDYGKRVDINRRVIALTESIAIRTKNENLASQLSIFIRKTYGNDFHKAYFYSNRILLNFYKSIKDSKQYLSLSNNWIYSLMNVSNDTLAKWDIKEQQFSASSNSEVKRYRKVSCEYASQLNNIAWSYYEMVTDLEDLAKALKWQKRALEINSEVCKPKNNDNSAFLDTYAHLLYKMNQFDEAISWEKKAIEARKNAGYNSNQLEQELEKMQSRTIKLPMDYR
jgi:tetratricopeptide (TPR) repeat protein